MALGVHNVDITLSPNDSDSSQVSGQCSLAVFAMGLEHKLAHLS